MEEDRRRLSFLSFWGRVLFAHGLAVILVLIFSLISLSHMFSFVVVYFGCVSYGAPQGTLGILFSFFLRGGGGKNTHHFCQDPELSKSGSHQVIRIVTSIGLYFPPDQIVPSWTLQ